MMTTQKTTDEWIRKAFEPRLIRLQSDYEFENGLKLRAHKSRPAITALHKSSIFAKLIFLLDSLPTIYIMSLSL